MTPLLLRVILLSCVTVSNAGRLGRLPKRRSSDGGGSSSSSSFVARAAEMLNLWKPTHVYHMDDDGARNALIDMLWTGDYEAASGRFTRANSELVSFFEELRIDGEDGRHFVLKKSSWPRFEGVLSLLFRARSQKYVPLETAALSVLFLHYRVPHAAWEAIAHFSRSVMSWSWTVDLCEDAVLRDPGAQYPTAQGMTAAVFDNFMIRVGYGSYATQESSATTFSMTNWATAFLPANSVPPDLSIDRILSTGGIFRVDRVLSDFVDLFSPVALDLLANKRSRWSTYLERVVTGAGIWEKEAFTSPFPPTKFHYHDPIFDRLQSSYEDVNFELDLMRKSVYHRYSDCIQLGGDGLSYMRIIHRLSQDPRQYLETKPVIIPRLGEAPHGKYHVLHGDWRLWAPLIMRFALLTNNRFVKRDPLVSEFNEHEHFLRILVEAFAEYIVEISQSGSDYHHVDHFLARADANLSFAYICYFLYLFGFKYLQMRSAIRKNDSATLDKVWRENLATARTSLANKTNYSQMTISVIYWGYALVEPLQTAFHQTRTLRWLQTHVGWDFVIEVMNSWIKESVVSNITEDYIRKFIRRLNFSHVVVRGMHSIMHRNRQAAKEKLKSIETDKKIVKDFLRNAIGADFATATTPSDENLLGLDLSEWGGSNRSRVNAPWAQMMRTMHDYREYVLHNVTKLCPWHHWVVP